jgi:hypothetical protein
MSPFDWWRQKPTTPYGTVTGFTLGTGARDIEKGAIFSVPAGQEVSVPEATRVAWADSQHVVLQDAAGNVLNLLHVNPDVPVGTDLAPNQPFGRVSGLVGSARDPVSHISYTESGDIVELGLYSTVQGAVSREVFVGGVDQPANFTGIHDPAPLLSAWQKGGPVPNLVGGPGGPPLAAGFLAGSGLQTPFGVLSWLVVGLVVLAAVLLAKGV